MITIASLMDSQKNSTKLRIHIAVVDNFTINNMLKIYSLRKKIREDVEFNFYNAKRVETELKGLHPKGNSVAAKLLLPEILPNDINKLIILDTGDLIVLKDLSEMYNWKMKGNLFCGVPDQGIGRFGKISKHIMKIYINAGNYLINVKKYKSEKIYNKCRKYKNSYRNFVAIQGFINDIGLGKICYIPVNFGLISPYKNDQNLDSLSFKTFYRYINKIKYEYKKKYPFLPKNEEEYKSQAFNPFVVHQWNGKWIKGQGLTIYRRIVQLYIRYAGIWDEICKQYPGYCKK